MEELRFLEEQQVSPELIRQAEEFRNTYTTDEAAVHRIVKPSIPFYGKEILELSLIHICGPAQRLWAALRILQQQNSLVSTV